MKPLNADESGCDPISSNCIIWQGPDIPCINLCKGDTVSAVIYKLGTELCEVLDILDIDSYELSCFNLGDCAPKDFQALLQLLITKICAAADCCTEMDVALRTADPTALTGTTVTIAPCFQYINAQGDLVTYMTVDEYAVAMGNKLCGIVGQITTIQATLTNHNTRITDLENAPVPTLNLPYIVPICVLPASPPKALDAVVIELERQFCELQTATGSPQALYEGIVAQCIGLNDSPRLQGSGTMSNIPNWNDVVTNLGQGIENIWYTLCDIRAAIQSIQEVCCTSTSCDDLLITLQGTLVDPTTLKLFLAGSVPAGFYESNPLGSQTIITDQSGNSITINVPITVNLNQPAGFSVVLAGTPINPNSNLTITMPIAYTDGTSSCTTVLTEVVISTENCPTVTLLSPTETQITWDFTYLGGAASIDVVLYDGTGTAIIQNQVSVVTGPTSINGLFSGLLAGVQYKVRLEITPSGAPEATLCPFGNIITMSPGCIPPMTITSNLIIS